jgi:hypothetical protein
MTDQISPVSASGPMSLEKPDGWIVKNKFGAVELFLHHERAMDALNAWGSFIGPVYQRTAGLAQTPAVPVAFRVKFKGDTGWTLYYSDPRSDLPGERGWLESVEPLFTLTDTSTDRAWSMADALTDEAAAKVDAALTVSSPKR